jgi:signal recognition particle subunit SEC65
MKATALLKKDHAAVKKLLTDFGRTTSRAVRKRQELMDKIAKELEIHTKIEEEIFYPAVKEVPEGRGLVKEAESEHKEVDSLVAEAQGMTMESDEVVQKVPVAEAGLGGRLAELGDEMAARKRELETSGAQKVKRAIKKAVRKIA